MSPVGVGGYPSLAYKYPGTRRVWSIHSSDRTEAAPKMIAYVLFVLAATPIFGLPATETVPAEHAPQQEKSQESSPTFQSQQQTLQYPFGQVSYPNVPYYTRKTESGAVEVPLTPDAIVIPYSYPNNPNYQNSQNYQYYPTVGSRYQYPSQYQNQYPNQYPNQYQYAPEPFLVLPVPNIPRVTAPNYPIPQYDNAPRLLYYLPKSYNQNQYQTQIHQQQQQVQQQQQTHETIQKSLTGVVNQPVQHGETTKPVVGTQQV